MDYLNFVLIMCIVPFNLCTNVPQEPSENGPLFSELKFYMRAAKPELSELFSPSLTAHMNWHTTTSSVSLWRQPNSTFLIKTDSPVAKAVCGEGGHWAPGHNSVFYIILIQLSISPDH